MKNTTARSIPSEYPEVTFCETDTEKITNALVAGYEALTKRTLYPADPVKVFILWIADIISQERELINYSARMNIPRYAEGEFLDALAEIFYNVHRLPPEHATCILRFELSVAQAEDYTIPQAIQVTVDGEIIFKTTETIIFKAGRTYVDVPAVCLTAGTAGNGFEAGQINKMVDEQFLYFKSVSNTTISEGGTERESDNEFYNRMRESTESYSTAGPVNAYIYHAKSVSSAVSDVTVTSPQPGMVDVRILLQDSEQPKEIILKKIEEVLSADDVRPLTDYVTVSTPEEDAFEVDLSFYIERNNQNDSNVIELNVQQAVEDYIKWQTEKMGRDINPSHLIKRIMDAGVKRVVVRKPEFRVVQETHVAKIMRNTIQIINGGIENA